MRGDRELLEMAARAADEGIVFYGECWRAQSGREWNPLLDDGDAFRLLVKLGMETYTNYDDAGQPEPFVGLLEPGQRPRYINEAHGDDPYAATRRAIVRVAAAIGATQHPARTEADVAEPCWCATCRPVSFGDMRMVLCPVCGNKRCPHATDHRYACTGSNEAGQVGSANMAHLTPQCLINGANMTQEEIEAIAQRPTYCKTDGEAVTLSRAERDALVAMARDSEMLDFMAARSAWIAWSRDGECCRVFHVDEDGQDVPICGWGAGKNWLTAREAIKAAMEKEQ